VRRLLGRIPTIGGRVVHGFHRGAPLGIPTANLRVRGVHLPPDGVYAVRARCRGEWCDGVANIGFNPTFGNRVRSVETHVLDFSGDLYGTWLEIGFIARLRGEQRFPDVQALLAQIRVDIAAARARLADDGV
jgi:riboflavin kinase/FMN adenylyltransferase